MLSVLPFSVLPGAILTEENDIQRGEEIPPGLDSRNNETRIQIQGPDSYCYIDSDILGGSVLVVVCLCVVLSWTL